MSEFERGFEVEPHSVQVKVIFSDLEVHIKYLRLDGNVEQEKRRLIQEHYPSGLHRVDDYVMILARHHGRQTRVLEDQSEMRSHVQDLGDDVEIYITESRLLCINIFFIHKSFSYNIIVVLFCF